MKFNIVKCSDIIDVRDGTHDSPKYVESGYPLVTSKNIKNNKINFENVNYISKEDFDKINKRSEVENGDILMPMIGTIGNPVLVNEETKFAIKNVALFKLARNEEINNMYFYYLLESEYIRRQLEAKKRGGTQSFVSLTNIRELKIPVPEREIQDKITMILDKSKALLDNRKKQIEILDELIESTFYSIFGDPRFNKHNFKTVKFGKMISILTDYHANGSYSILKENVELLDKEDYALMIRTTDLENEVYNREVKYITRDAYNFLNKTKVYGGEIIINKIGSAGNVYFMPCLNRPVSLAMNQFMIRVNDNMNNIFIYYLLKSKYGEDELKNRIQGAVTKTITKDAVRDIDLIKPPIELQNQFAEIVKKIEKEKELLKQSLEQLETNFKALEQKAFNGELFN